jgi:hypothetical protein
LKSGAARFYQIEARRDMTNPPTIFTKKCAGSHMARMGQELRRGCPQFTFKRQIAQS